MAPVLWPKALSEVITPYKLELWSVSMNRWKRLRQLMGFTIFTLVIRPEIKGVRLATRDDMRGHEIVTPDGLAFLM
ncbi:hypothetical protein J2T15_003151 [Paenibacillus harenae]|uniref:Uncharacterized protein n=1 Tax=Paenibacillus harenae TaxID=306543 RepID=A0ABT9U405_PAEHA|nr:hypothetical protein [Paenibacillus harenae]